MRSWPPSGAVPGVEETLLAAAVPLCWRSWPGSREGARGPGTLCSSLRSQNAARSEVPGLSRLNSSLLRPMLGLVD